MQIAQEKSAINRMLQSHGLGRLEDGSGLLSKLGFLVQDHEHLRSLLVRCEQNRSAMYHSLTPYLRFTKDLTGQLAGLNPSQAGPQGPAKFADIGTGAGLLMGVAKGLVNQVAAASLAATSPRLTGELMVAISKASPGLGRATMAAPILGIPNAGGVLARNPADQQ